ncbi:AraC family transcriptional regulator [Lactobacillus sp. PFC-70]|nr:AraC family transcriptional regulator [Lactobacillus sp. PFC-70]
MTLEQLYISSLNLPAAQVKISSSGNIVQFKTGKVLTHKYLQLLKHVAHHDGFTIFRHTQTLYTFCFIKDHIAYLIGPEIVNDLPHQHQFDATYQIVYLAKRLNTTVMGKDQCYKQVLFFSQLLGMPVTTAQTDAAFAHAIPSDQLNDLITTVNFKEKGVHISYVYEKALKSAVLAGDTAVIHTAFTGLVESGRIGILSDKSKIRGLKNWGIICVSVTIRAAINAGLDYDQAYSLNDQYVRTIEQLTSFTEIMQTIEEILVDMANRVNHLRNVHLSTNVRAIYQAIMDSPETTTTITQFGNQLGRSPRYLSQQFKQEVGVSIPKFKRLAKVNQAIQLINATNFSMARIAEILNFSDQAHFTRDFKALVGVDPSTVRKNPHTAEKWNLYDYTKINVGGR